MAESTCSPYPSILCWVYTVLVTRSQLAGLSSLLLSSIALSVALRVLVNPCGCKTSTATQKRVFSTWIAWSPVQTMFQYWLTPCWGLPGSSTLLSHNNYSILPPFHLVSPYVRFAGKDCGRFSVSKTNIATGLVTWTNKRFYLHALSLFPSWIS